MARDLKLNVDGDAGGGERALEAVAAAADLAAREADRLGKQFKQAQRDAAGLDRQLLETAAAARLLAVELSKNPADKTVKASLDAEKKRAAELKSLSKDIIGDTEKAAKVAERFASEAAKDFAKFGAEAEKAGMSIGDLFSGGLTSPAGLGGLAAAAPLILGAAGALTALAAAGAVAGAGVAGAVMGDPAEFKRHWDPVVSDLKKQFLDATYVFQGPALAAVDSIGTTIRGLDLKGVFAAAVPYVEPLVQGTEGFATNIVSGVETLVKDAGPVIKTFSTDLPAIGNAISGALSDIGSQAQGGAEALHAVDLALEGIITGTGKVIAGAEAISGGIHDASQATRDFFDSIPTWVQVALPWLALYRKGFDEAVGTGDKVTHLTMTQKGLADAAKAAGDAFSAEGDDLTALQKTLNAATLSTDVLAGQLSDKVLGGLLDADHATLSWDESLTHLSQSFKDNGKSLDIHTEKGQANREAVLAAVAANVQQYDSILRISGSSVDAANAYDAGTAALERQLRQAGLNQAAIDGLIGKYRDVPKNIDSTIAVDGLTKAINDLADLIRKLAGLDGKNFKSTFTLTYKTVGHPLVGESGTIPLHPGSAFAHGGIRHAATGLIVGPSNPGSVLFGEPQTGGEVLIPRKGIDVGRAADLGRAALGDYGLDVVSRQQPRIPAGLFNRGGGGGGREQLELVVSSAGGNGLEAVLAAWLARATRTGDVRVHSNAIVQ